MDMKPVSGCKIAVCFSGQSRTYEYCAESITDFFKSDVTNEYYFFGHTNNKNSYKPPPDLPGELKHEILDSAELYNNLQQLFGFSKLIVGEEKHRGIHFGIQLHSQMISNFLKQQFEIENNMMFDVVVRARFDVCYPNKSNFINFVNGPIQEKTLYSHFGLMRPEFILPTPSSIIHYGSSLTMDLVDSVYNTLITGAFHKLVGYDNYNPIWQRAGDGPLIYKWCTLKNILLMESDIPFAIVRNHSLDLDYKLEWERLVRRGWLDNV